MPNMPAWGYLFWLAAGVVSCPAVADLAETIARVKPAVVMVGLYQPLGSPQFVLRGTGFIVADGLTVATNAHVVAEIKPEAEGGRLVVLAGAVASDRARSARVVSMDKTHDLAVLRIDGTPLPGLALADSSQVKEGQSVAFTGFPIGNLLGFTPVTHRAMVSAITPIVMPTGNAQQLRGSAIRGIRDGGFDIFQLDGTAYPGNSGGPLFDVETGSVIGVINMVMVKNTKEAAMSQPSGISYAIPANYLRDLLRGGQ